MRFIFWDLFSSHVLLWDFPSLHLAGLSETCHPLTAMLDVTPFCPDSAALLQVTNPNKSSLTQRRGSVPNTAVCLAHSCLTCPLTTENQGFFPLSPASGEKKNCNVRICNLQCQGTGQGRRKPGLIMCTKGTCSLTHTPLERTIPTLPDQINSIRPNSCPSYKKF